jgi:hypothetical protein
MDLELVIGTSTKTQYLTPNTVNLYDNLDARTALSFQLRMPSSDTRPVVGQPVYLLSGTSYAFGGTLDNYAETVLNPLGSTTPYLTLNCNSVDFTQMVGKRLVYKSYTSTGLGDYDLVPTTESFTGDGVTRTWALAYPTSTDPTVTVNGFAASVAPVGSASTFGYYYTGSSNILLANTSNSAPASTDTLSVVYSAMVGKAAYDYQIIKDIADNFFDGEGIDAETYVSTGVRVPELNFNFAPGNEAINTLCKVTGRSWYIDSTKALHYFARSDNPAPFDITSTSDNWRSLTVRRSREKYRNKEYVLNSFGNLPTTESFAGDGKTRTFSLASPCYGKPVITLNGYNCDVSDLSGSSTHGYYYSLESNIITSNSTNNAIASTDTLAVQYLGLYPVVAVAVDGEEVAVRAAIEGNSGVYEEAETGNKTYVSTHAIEYGNSILEKYGKPLEQIEFETDTDGLKSGQIIKITVSANDLDDYYYIISVTARDISMATLRYKVVAVSGTDRGGWVSFFRSLISDVNQVYTEPYVNLTQTLALTRTENLEVSDAVTVTITVLTICYVDTAQVDTAMVT